MLANQRRVTRWSGLLARVAAGLLVASVVFGPAPWLLVRAAEQTYESPSYRVLEGEVPPEVASWCETYRRYPGLFRFTAADTTYLLLSWGEKCTGGYGLTLKGMHREGDVIVAEVALKAPGPEDVVTQVITNPHVLVALPATTAPFAAEFTGAAWAPVGEGLPLCSTDFFVDTPMPMAPVSSPLRVNGVARTFEGTFRLSIEDGHDELGSIVVRADRAAPAWGTFSVDLPFRKPSSPSGHLVLSVADTKGGQWIPKMGIPVRFRAGEASDFPDIRGHWGESVVRRAAGRGLVSGYPDGHFHPDRDITRGEFIRILTTAFALTPKGSLPSGFADTAPHWASPYVNAALAAGVLVEADYPQHRFEPDRPITRLEMAVQLVRALGKQEEATKPENLETGLGYRDAADIPASLRGYVGVTTRMGITTGFPDCTFGPEKLATRAQATATIMRALDAQEAARNAVAFFRYWGDLDLERMKALMLQPPEKFIPGSDIVFAPFYPKKYPDDVAAFTRASRNLIRQYDAAAWENIVLEETHVHPAVLPPKVTVSLRLGQAPYHIWAEMELSDDGWTGWRVRMLDSLPIKSEQKTPPSSYSLERLQPMDVRDLDDTPGAEILGWAFWGEYEGMGPEPPGARGLFSLKDGQMTRLWFTTEGPAPGWVWTGEGVMGHLTSPESFDLLLVTRPANLDGKQVRDEGPRLVLYRVKPCLEKVAEIPWPQVAPPGTSVYYGLMAARPLDGIPGDEIVISAFCTPPSGSAYQLVVITRLEETSLRVLATHKSAAGQSLYLTFTPPSPQAAECGTTAPHRLYVWTWGGQEITALACRQGEFSFTSFPLAHQAVLAAADLDGDGRDEFLVDTPHHRLQLLARDSSILWETEAYKAVGQAWMARVGGRVTIVASEPGADANRIVRWEEVPAPSATGQAQTAQVQAVTLQHAWTSPPLGRARISSLWVTDLDGDGDLEVAATSTDEHLAPADYFHVFDLASGTLSPPQGHP